MTTFERIQRFVLGLGPCSRCSDMHRRAQAAESKAAAVPRQFEGAIQEATKRMGHAQWMRGLYRRRNRALYQLLKNAGVPQEATNEAVRVADKIRLDEERIGALVHALERVEHCGCDGDSEDGCGWCLGEDDYTIEMADAGVHVAGCPVGKALYRPSSPRQGVSPKEGDGT